MYAEFYIVAVNCSIPPCIRVGYSIIDFNLILTRQGWLKCTPNRNF